MVLLLTSAASTTAVSRALLATPRQADGGFVVIITMMTIPRALLAGLVDGPCALLATPQQAALSLGRARSPPHLDRRPCCQASCAPPHAVVGGLILKGEEEEEEEGKG